MTANSKKKQLLDDLQRHLSQKLRQQLYDIAMTAKLMDVTDKEIMHMAITEYLFQLIVAAVSIGMEKDDYMKSCSIGWNSMVDAAVEQLVRADET